MSRPHAQDTVPTSDARAVGVDTARQRGYSNATSTSAQIAQLVEQGIENPRVGGSIPSLGTEVARIRGGSGCEGRRPLPCRFERVTRTVG